MSVLLAIIISQWTKRRFQKFLARGLMSVIRFKIPFGVRILPLIEWLASWELLSMITLNNSIQNVMLIASRIHKTFVVRIVFKIINSKSAVSTSIANSYQLIGLYFLFIRIPSEPIRGGRDSRLNGLLAILVLVVAMLLGSKVLVLLLYKIVKW